MTSHGRLYKTVLLAVGAGAASVAIGVALLLVAILDLRSSADATLRTDTYLVRVIDVERSIVDTETALRGYVLTAHPLFLAPLLSAERQLPVETSALEREAVREHAFVSQAQGLSNAAESYLSGYAVPLLGQMARNPAAARTFASTLHGKQVVDDIRRRTATLEAAVSARQTARENAAHDSADRAVITAIVVLVLLTALTVLLGGILGRLLIGRERARERSSLLAEASKQLDRAVTIEQLLDTFGAFVDGRLSEGCVARALTGDVFTDVTPSLESTCGDPRLLDATTSNAVSDAIERVRGAAVAAAVTTGKAVAFTHEGEPLHGLAVAGLAHGRLVADTILLRRARPYRGEEIDEAAELTSRLALAVHARGLQAQTSALYERSERTAVTLQESLLPSEMPEIPACELAVRFTPAGQGDLVGGDFYDVFEVEPGRWAIVVGDVCGKGAEAAAVTAMARWTLRSLAGSAVAPADALRHLNDAMLRQDLEGRFITLAYLLLTVRPSSAHVSVACGGHPPPVLVPAVGEPVALEVRGDLIGVWPDIELQTVELDLAPGDAVVVYTDGVTDQGPEPSRAPEAALRDRAPGATAAALAATLEDQALSSGAARRDDIAILAVRYTRGHTAVQNPPAVGPVRAARMSGERA